MAIFDYWIPLLVYEIGLAACSTYNPSREEASVSPGSCSQGWMALAPLAPKVEPETLGVLRRVIGPLYVLPRTHQREIANSESLRAF